MKAGIGRVGLGGVMALVFIIVFSSCNKNTQVSTGPWENSTGADSISFLVMGDWGRYGGESQRSVADQMDETGRKFHVQAIITTGDNFYPSGISSINDGHWKGSFEDIYNKQGHQVPWYPVLGNHDYLGNPGAEVQYSTVSNRWKMPARYYTIQKGFGDSSSVMLAFTDTSPFVTGYYGGGMADLQQQDTAAQLRWLRQTLSGSKDTWKIAVGHHPLYSVGPHGNTYELIERFKPVFLQTHTDFYVCGHDHSLQYNTVPGETTRYLVSGGGSEYTSVSPNSYSVFARALPGFLVMTFYADMANFYFYNQRGDLLFRQQVRR